MKNINLIVVSLATVLIFGCASPERAALLGSGMGATSGAGVGALTGGSAGNIIVGGALGGLLGAGAGYIANDISEKSNKEAFEKGRDSAKKNPSSYVGRQSQPTLVPPRVQTRFVDDQVRGSVFIPAHVEYIILEPARWSR